jgi:tRNA G10  N-methylase Trm11
MKYFFVLGRNPLLSEAEILSCLEREGIRKLSHKMRLNSLIIEVDKELNLSKMVNELGGTIAVGRVLLSGNADKVIGEIKNKPIYIGRENKVVYSVLNYADEELFDMIHNAMKENFRNERLKARYKGVSGTIKLQSGKIMHGSPEKILLRDMNYFVFENQETKEACFGFLEASYDSSEAEKRDMKKPFRRESLAISPRLARILINLSQVKEGEVLLDPFCGIGVILGEALLRGINAIGIDIDGNAVNNARENISWLKNNYKIDADFKIINDDSGKIRLNEEIAGIATEPALGELMTRIPSREKGMRVAREFEELIIPVLNNIKKGIKKEGKIAFTAPLIKTQGGKVSCDIDNICRKTGLKVYELKDSCIKFPLSEFREEQIIGRDIFVLVS